MHLIQLMDKRSALIAGATGLVGNELLHILINSQKYEKIYALVRRPIEVKHPIPTLLRSFVILSD